MKLADAADPLNFLVQPKKTRKLRMNAVNNLAQIVKNFRELERGRKTNSEYFSEYASLIQKGTCFVPYKSKTGIAFAPSRFVGYAGNKLASHARNSSRDGRVTTTALSKIFGAKPIVNAVLDEAYCNFCQSIELKYRKSGSFGVQRKYWITEDTKELLTGSEEGEVSEDGTQDYWSTIPELTNGPFIAINITSREPSSKSLNNEFMSNAKTGNWDIPQAAKHDGIKGKTVILFYSVKSQPSELYIGEIKSSTIAGKTKHVTPRNRFLLEVKKNWQLIGKTRRSFSDFFSGFSMSSNPTTVWIDPSAYEAPRDETGDETLEITTPYPPGLSYMAWVALRANHHIFVRNLKKTRGAACSLTGILTPRLVHAAHIVPWNIAEGREKTSEHNGLMLCAHLHALFDSHLLSFDDDGRVLISPMMAENVRALVASGGSTRLKHTPSPQQVKFLERHRSASGRAKWTLLE
jgi:hypothetical protein